MEVQVILGLALLAVGFLAGNYWAHRKLAGITAAVTAIKGKLGVS